MYFFLTVIFAPFLQLQFFENMQRWQNRIVLVTGASSGMGYCIAEELARKGMHVIGCARNIQPIMDLKTSLEKTGARLEAIECDLKKKEHILRMFGEIEARFGHADVLINNAATALFASFLDGKTEDWQEMLDVNTLAVAICTREAIRLMQKAGISDGHIINVNSTIGHVMPDYDQFHMMATTKHIITAMTKAVDMELKNKNSQIRITSLSPGHVATATATEKSKEQGFRFLDPQDVADAVVYILATPAHVLVRELILMPIEAPSMLV